MNQVNSYDTLLRFNHCERFNLQL